MKNTFNSIIVTLLFYVLYCCACWIANYFSPSGPCTRGLGFMMFLGFLPLSGLLFFKNLFKFYINPKRKRIYLMAIHLLVFIGFVILIKMA